MRRIAVKVIVMHTRNDIVTSVGSLQDCADHEAGCESLIHAMHSVYEKQWAKAVLLVDASNAFNSSNRNPFLECRNYMPINCKVCKKLLFTWQLIIHNCCWGYPVNGRDRQFGCYANYEITIIPVILMLVEISLQKIYNIFTAAYVDHLTAVGPVDQLQKWWGEIWRLVPRFGYYPEGSNIFKKSIVSENYFVSMIHLV